MTDTTLQKKAEDTVNRSLIEYYVRVLTIPTIIAGIFQISALLSNEKNEVLLLLVANAALVILTILYTIRINGIWIHAATAASFSGAISAIFIAIVQLIQIPSVIYVFNLFTAPTIAAILDALAASLLFTIIHQIMNKTKLKGGDLHD